MRYLIDTNIFIESKNTFYGFDICPGFWDWLSKTNIVLSIDFVKEEILHGKDDLSEWVKKTLPESFFMDADKEIQESYREIASYVQGLSFTQNAKNDFLSVADGWLIATARVRGMSIITHETFDAKIKSKVKLPNIAHHYSVACLKIYDVLRKEEVKFICQ